MFAVFAHVSKGLVVMPSGLRRAAGGFGRSG
jgi:hypothetical protein